MKFLIGFIEFVVKLAERAKKMAPEVLSMQYSTFRPYRITNFNI